MNNQRTGPVAPPVPSGNPNENPNPNPKSISFDEVSKLFNLPLSEAAESLGVCASVLKKICYDNGLVRWPYRKFLLGKSLEDIKKDAVREKQEHRAELPKTAGEKQNSVASSPILSPLAPPLQNKSISYTLEMLKPGGPVTQQHTKNAQSGSSAHLRSSNVTRGASVSSDEFKYGFPSDGLSMVTYRWWGNKSPDNDEDSQQNDDKTISSRERAENIADKSDSKTLVDSLGTSLLSDVRKQTVEEGKKALKLGVYRGYSAKMLNSTKRKVLLRVFKSSFPFES